MAFQDWLAWSLYCDRTDCDNASLKYGGGNENRKEEIDLKDPWQWNYRTWLLNMEPDVGRRQRSLQTLWAWDEKSSPGRKNVLTVTGLLLSPGCPELCNRLHFKYLGSKSMSHSFSRLCYPGIYFLHSDPLPTIGFIYWKVQCWATLQLTRPRGYKNIAFNVFFKVKPCKKNCNKNSPP